MYVILVYDFEQKRVGKALKICRRFLNWVQNSVFEGELTESKLKTLKMELKKLMHPEKDAILLYRVRDKSMLQIENMGIEKNTPDQFL